MKTILFFFSTLAILFAAEPTCQPREALDKFGIFTITDNSSYFTFSKDGTFKSGPMGMSGRELRGTWMLSDSTQFTVTAQVGWVNGLQPRDDYRRIIFRISSLQKKAGRALEVTGKAGVFFMLDFAPSELFDSYCFIEEFVSIRKPKDEKSLPP